MDGGKGHPKSICQDAIKFLNWACRDEGHKKHAHHKSGTADHHHPHRQHDPGAEASAEEDEDSVSEDSSDSDYYSDTEVEHHGLIASFAYLVNAGLERYAPQAVLDYLPHGHSRQSSTVSTTQENGYPTDDKEDPQTEPTPTPTTTTTTAKPTEPEFNDAASQGKASVAFSANSAFDSAVDAPPDVSAIEQMTLNKKGKLSSHEKQLAKLAERKRNVEAQLDRVRSEIQALHVETTPASLPQTATAEGGSNKRDKASAAALAAAGDVGSEQLSSSPGSSVHRGVASSGGNNHPHHPNRHEAARAHKVASGLFNEESKLLKQLGKIEKDQVKEASKIEARQQKHAEKQEKSRARGEADALRREVELLKKEVDRLRSERKQWLDLIGSLQAENTRLAAQQDPGAANAAAAGAGGSSTTTKLNEEKK